MAPLGRSVLLPLQPQSLPQTLSKEGNTPTEIEEASFQKETESELPCELQGDGNIRGADAPLEP